jgi:hypothetical protein
MVSAWQQWRSWVNGYAFGESSERYPQEAPEQVSQAFHSSISSFSDSTSILQCIYVIAQSFL